MNLAMPKWSYIAYSKMKYLSLFAIHVAMLKLVFGIITGRKRISRRKIYHHPFLAPLYVDDSMFHLSQQ
jgi:hypothetical protein